MFDPSAATLYSLRILGSDPKVRESNNILIPSLLVSDYGIKALGER